MAPLPRPIPPPLASSGPHRSIPPREPGWHVDCFEISATQRGEGSGQSGGPQHSSTKRGRARCPEPDSRDPRLSHHTERLVLKSLVRLMPGVPQPDDAGRSEAGVPPGEGSPTIPGVRPGTPRPTSLQVHGPSALVPCHAEGPIVFREIFTAGRVILRGLSPEPVSPGHPAGRPGAGPPLPQRGAAATGGRADRARTRSAGPARRTRRTRCRSRTWRSERSRSAE